MPRLPAPLSVGPLTLYESRERVAKHFIRYMDRTKDEVLIMYGQPPIGIKDADRATRRALRRGVRIRSLYPEERATADTLQDIEPHLRAGERVRFGRYVPTRMAIFDRKRVLIALAISVEPPTFQAIEAEHPEMVSLAVYAFEHAWRDGWEYIPPARRRRRKARTI